MRCMDMKEECQALSCKGKESVTEYDSRVLSIKKDCQAVCTQTEYLAACQ
jgi:hypothetical protein